MPPEVQRLAVIIKETAVHVLATAGALHLAVEQGEVSTITARCTVTERHNGQGYSCVNQLGHNSINKEHKAFNKGPSAQQPTSNRNDRVTTRNKLSVLFAKNGPS